MISKKIKNFVFQRAVGRATIETLDLNRKGLINLRRVLLTLGIHPPK